MDAPFFLYGGLALATGRGEQLSPLSAVPELSLVVLIPDFMIPTPDAYRGLPPRLTNAPDKGGNRSTDRLIELLGSYPQGFRCSGKLLAECLQNDLEKSTVLRRIRPPDAISRMRGALTAAGAAAAAMSGSGSAVFGVFRDRKQAMLAASRLSGDEYRAIATRTISREEHRMALCGN